jgi:benzoylformate decarboxylase
MVSVREATFEVARFYGLTTWFGNPGSTEIPLLSDFPDDLTYVLALHENAAVAMAAGFALAHGRPAMVSLHTTAGLGNAVCSIATSRVNRAPLVILVGQQDRRHIRSTPFLTGRLRNLAGDYPVAVEEPERAQDVPSAVAQAFHAAVFERGPAVVIVPMDDWDQQMDDTVTVAPELAARAAGVAADDVAAIAVLIDESANPVLVTGSDADTPEAWAALTTLADQLNCAVWQEPFTARAGFPQDHARFAGFLPAARGPLRAALRDHDLVIVVGTALLRQYHFEPGPLLMPGTKSVVITADQAEAVRSPASFALVGPIAAACQAIAAAVKARTTTPSGDIGAAHRDRERVRSLFAEPSPDQTLAPEEVFAVLADRLDADTILVEETPSSRELLQLIVPARENFGYLSAAMGGLGFAIPASIGLRMADPARPVVAVVGDGSAMYCIQALWSAAHYGVGVLIIVMDNANYAVMNRLTAQLGKAPWPSFSEVSMDKLSSSLGCPAVSVNSLDHLTKLLDEVVPTLRDRREPLVVNVEVTAAGGRS